MIIFHDLLYQVLVQSVKLYHLFRYGGWYTDLDTVTIRPTNHIENTVAISGDFVANGNLVFSKNYKVRYRDGLFLIKSISQIQYKEEIF